MKVKLENKNDKIENLPGLSIEDGTCIFPFVHDEKEYEECYKGQRGDWCATKVSKKTKKIKKWAYCDTKKLKITRKKKDDDAPKRLRFTSKPFSPDMVASNFKMYKTSKIVPDYYVLPNKKGFINWFDTMYSSYRVKQSKKNARFDLFNHQKIIRDYMSNISPYRGLLLYHGLGVGKTCGSIAIAEGFRSDKNIVVLLNKSLKQNLIEKS